MIAVVLCGIALVLAAFVLGMLTAETRIQHRVFSPWQHSIPTYDPNFWLRQRDYSAAWNGFCRASVMRLPGSARLRFLNGDDVTFSTPPTDLLTKETA